MQGWCCRVDHFGAAAWKTPSFPPVDVATLVCLLLFSALASFSILGNPFSFRSIFFLGFFYLFSQPLVLPLWWRFLIFFGLRLYPVRGCKTSLGSLRGFRCCISKEIRASAPLGKKKHTKYMYLVTN